MEQGTGKEEETWKLGNVRQQIAFWLMVRVQSLGDLYVGQAMQLTCYDEVANSIVGDVDHSLANLEEEEEEED